MGEGVIAIPLSGFSDADVTCASHVDRRITLLKSFCLLWQHLVFFIRHHSIDSKVLQRSLLQKEGRAKPKVGFCWVRLVSCHVLLGPDSESAGIFVFEWNIGNREPPQRISVRNRGWSFCSIVNYRVHRDPQALSNILDVGLKCELRTVPCR